MFNKENAFKKFMMYTNALNKNLDEVALILHWSIQHLLILFFSKRWF